MSKVAARWAGMVLAFAAAGAVAACGGIVDADRPEVASVTISEPSVNLEVGASQQLTAIVKDAAGNTLSNRTVFWSTEDGAVATISTTGLVTAVGPGSSRIAASVESKSDLASVVVVPKPVASVTVAPPSASLRIGETVQLEATARDAGGNPLHGRHIGWESSNQGAAVVEADGLVRAVGMGTATITATSEGRSGAASITVVSGPPAAIEAVQGGGIGVAGAALPDSLVVRVTDAQGNPVPGATVAWTVTSGEGTISPASTATGADGVARAQWTLGTRPGNQTATASVADLQPVTFTATARPGLIASVTVEPPTATIGALSSTRAFTATAYDAHQNPIPDQSFTWTSSQSTVATINTSGVALAVANGQTTITARAGTVSGTATMQVAQVVTQVSVNSQNVTLPVGGTAQLTASARDAHNHPVAGATISWGTSNSAVATVSPQGLVQAVAVGTATITASSGGQSANANVTVVAGVPAKLEVVQGGGTGVVGAPLPDSLVVRVTDAQGNPVPGATVQWAITSGGGTISPASTPTNAQGLARAEWRLGIRPGNQTATASVAGLQPVTFTATARPGAVASVSVDPSTATITALSATRAFAAAAYDTYENPVPDQSFTWTSSASEVAAINGSGVATAVANGQATITARTGTVSGTAALQVAQAVARVSVSQPEVTLLVGETAQLSATATDANDHPVAGATISWGTSNSAIATVNGSGEVRGLGVGTATVTASSGGRSANASVTVERTPVASVGVSPAAASRRVGEWAQFTATAYDAGGNELTGREIGWESSNTQVASVNNVGVATALRPGTATIIARSEGRQGTAVFSVTGGPPANLSGVSGNNQSAAVRTAVSQPLVIRVTDAAGNPLSGVEVTWTVVSGGGTLSPQSAGTNTAGETSAGWTLGGQLGANTARASVSGLAPVTFSAVAVAGPATAIQIVSGNNQVGPGGQTLPQPLVVRVTDVHGNPVSDARVTWHLVRGNGSLNPSTTNTNAQGQASTSWTLANGPPDQIVEARVGNLAPAVFNAARGVAR